MKHTPTDEQRDIIDAFKGTRDNILVNALAGAAKTTTLEMVCEAVTGIPILSLAFNKRIKEEMEKRLPSHVMCKTINGIGHSAWAEKIGKRLVVDTKKNYLILKEEINKLPKDLQDRAWMDFADTLAAIRRAKTVGYIPNASFKDVPRVIDTEKFVAGFEDEPDMELIDDCLKRDIMQGFDGHIDYDDQIYLPTLFGGKFPRFALNLVDEAQDFNGLNILMLSKIVGDNRLGGVGDRNQSIYAFRGALTRSMETMRDRFAMSEMTLSTSFRCPISVVELARKHTPQMQWAPWARQGLVEHLDEWSAADITNGAAVICRNNAPLMKLAYRLLSEGRGVKVVGTDLGPSLVRAFKKFGDESMTQSQLMAAIDSWEQDHLDRGKDTVSDKAACLRVFAEFGPTMGAAIAYVEKIFAAGGPIQLLSGHKSKGGEWDVVYHLDSFLVPSRYAETDEEVQQESNLEYVITTRSKDKLFFINSEDMKGNGNNAP
jgi:superfamily I DNA/RNA helicase